MLYLLFVATKIAIVQTFRDIMKDISFIILMFCVLNQ